jgi:hypothetical protein
MLIQTPIPDWKISKAAKEIFDLSQRRHDSKATWGKQSDDVRAQWRAMVKRVVAVLEDEE